MLNKVILIGRLTKDADMRYTQNEKQITKFTIAVNRMGKKDKADFVQIVCFGKTAEVTANLGKGQMVAIEGKLQIDNVKGDKGWKTYVSVVANRVVFLSPKQKDNLGEPLDFNDEDLPF